MKRRLTILAVFSFAAFGLSLYPSVGCAQTSHHSALTSKFLSSRSSGTKSFQPESTGSGPCSAPSRTKPALTSSKCEAP